MSMSAKNMETTDSIRFGVGKCWLGAIAVAATGKGICAILLGDDAGVIRDVWDRFPAALPIDDGDEEFDRRVDKVVEFVEAPARGLDLPLDPQGTPFQLRVWESLRQLPSGSTVSYSEIARRLGAPKEAYLVAEACAANAIAVAIPCHRVVRKDGSLAGYRWGFKRKRALLEREAAS